MGEQVDAALAAFLAAAAEADAPPITAGTIADARAGNAAFLATMRTRTIEVATVVDVAVPTRAGSVPAREYTPYDGATAVVVYLHGGGWVLGDLEGHDQLCRQLAVEAGAIVVNVNYRHAPEVPFPGPVEDAVDAVAWAAEHYDLPLAVAGDSAGGNLAAAAAVAARDAGVEVGLQALLYPVLDADLDRDSYRRNGAGYLLTTADMDWFWTQYVGEADRFDPRASVLRTTDLAGVAPALVVVAGFDPLRDEGIAYGRRLEEAGVACEVLEYPGAIHGFATLHAITPLADEAVGAVAAAIRTHAARSSRRQQTTTDETRTR